MKNVPWYIQDDKDNIIDDLQNNTKMKTKLNLTRKAGSVINDIKVAAVSLVSQVINSVVNNYKKKNSSPKSILDSAVKLQEIDLNSRIELHFYMGEKSFHHP